jgi:hypothetical protein
VASLRSVPRAQRSVERRVHNLQPPQAGVRLMHLFGRSRLRI